MTRRITARAALAALAISIAACGQDSMPRGRHRARDFHPFDSKYDAFLAGKARLTD